jgi:hypothetical protein
MGGDRHHLATVVLDRRFGLAQCALVASVHHDTRA